MRWLSVLFFHFWLILFGNSSFGQGNWEFNWLKSTNLDRNQNLDPLAEGFSYSVLPLTLAFPFADYFIHRKEKPDRNYRILTFCGGIGLHGVVSYGLKLGINRPRPFEKYLELDNVVKPSTGSFPSGHTGFAFHTATLIFLEYPKWYVALPAFSWAGLAGYSRLHLGVHYPTDVFAGVGLGIATGYLSHEANRWIQKKGKKGKNTEGF